MAMNMPRKSPANRIAFLRTSRKWTQQELAERVNAHWVTISKLERGEMKLTLDWMQRLALAFSVEPNQIIVNRETAYGIDGFISRAGVVDLRDVGTDVVEWSIEIGKYFSLQESLWYYALDALYPPVIRAHDLLRFTHFYDLERHSLLDRICLLPHLPSSVPLIGVLHRGTKEGLYDLDMPDGTVRRDIAHATDALMVLTLVISRSDKPVEQQRPDDYE